jgi:hypothetical protein
MASNAVAGVLQLQGLSSLDRSGSRNRVLDDETVPCTLNLVAAAEYCAVWLVAGLFSCCFGGLVLLLSSAYLLVSFAAVGLVHF